MAKKISYKELEQRIAACEKTEANRKRKKEQLQREVLVLLNLYALTGPASILTPLFLF
jgi:hypothetical protein